MDIVIEYLSILIPIIVVELVLMTTACIHVLKYNKFKFGNKLMWLAIVIFIQIIGPISYFTIGRSND